jgi:hypothetical protein
MNILYLGPYRQYDYNGIISRKYINTIVQAKHIQLTTRPIYIDASCEHKDIPKNIVELEHNILNTYDMLVQHLPLNYLAINKKMKNVAIPILNINKINTFNQYKLNEFDMVLVNNIYAKTSIDPLLNTPSKMFDFNIDTNMLREYIGKRLDLGIFNHFQKFYFIGDHNTNTDIVEDIIKAFYTNYYSFNDTCLILFLRNINSDIEEYIKKIHNKFKIKDSMHSILIVPIGTNEQDIIAAHGSCNIFLDINDDNRESLHNKYVQFFKNKTITLLDLSLSKSRIRNNKTSMEYFDTVDTYNLSNHFMDIIKKSSVTTIPNDIKSLETILCH